MDPRSMLKSPLARLVFFSLLVSNLLMTTALPYHYNHQMPSKRDMLDLPSDDADDDDFSHISMPLLGRNPVEASLSDMDVKEVLNMLSDATSGRNNQGLSKAKSKRFDYGFAGLDTYDAIQRALQDGSGKGRGRQGAGYSMRQLMQRHG